MRRDQRNNNMSSGGSFLGGGAGGQAQAGMTPQQQAFLRQQQALSQPLPNPNPPAQIGAITASNGWGNGQAQDLYFHLGMPTSARGDRPELSILGQRLIPLMGSRVQNQLLFGNEMLEPQQALIRRMIKSHSPGSKQANLAAYMRGMNSMAPMQAKLNDALLMNLGRGSGLRNGALLDRISQNAMAGHDFNARQHTAAYDMAQLGPVMQAIQMGLANHGDQFLAMAGLGNNVPQKQSNPGILGAVAPFLGNAVGAFLGAA